MIQLLDRLRQVAACQEPDDLLQSYVVLLQVRPQVIICMWYTLSQLPVSHASWL